MKLNALLSVLVLSPIAFSVTACDEEAEPRSVQTDFDDENDVDEEDYADGQEAPPDIMMSSSLGWEATRNIRIQDGLPAGCEYIDLHTGWIDQAGYWGNEWLPKGQRTVLNARTACGKINLRVGFFDHRGRQTSTGTISGGNSGWYQQTASVFAGEVYVNYATVCLVGDSEATKNHANRCWGIYR